MGKRNRAWVEEADEPRPSKSARKRHMTALQELGEALTLLSDRQLAAIPLDDERLSLSVREARKIRQHGARRRHLQYIGKLMRDIDATPIVEAMDRLDSPPPALHKLMLYWRGESAAGSASSEDSREG